MRKWIDAAFLIACGGLTALGVLSIADGARAQPGESTETSSARRWEYRVISGRDVLPQEKLHEGGGAIGMMPAEIQVALSRALSGDLLGDFERKFNELGADGWELWLELGDNCKLYVFKRLQPSPASP